MNNIKKGFTLIELLLYIGVITIVLGAMVPFAWNIIGGGAKSAVSQEVFDNARFISEKIKSEIRGASDLGSFSPNSITLTNFSPNTSTVIDLSGGQVRLNKNGTGPVNLSASGVTVSDLTFTNYSSGDNKTKYLGFTLTVETTGVRQEYQQSISLRSGAEIRSNQ